MSDGAKIVIAGIMAYTIYRVAGKCTDARIAIAAMRCGVTMKLEEKEKGLAMAISKYFFDNAGYYNDVFKKWIPKKETVEVDGDKN